MITINIEVPLIQRLSLYFAILFLVLCIGGILA